MELIDKEKLLYYLENEKNKIKGMLFSPYDEGVYDGLVKAIRKINKFPTIDKAEIGGIK